MTDNNEQRLALAYICKANSWVEQLISFVGQGPRENFQMELCLRDYHIKVLTHEVPDRGFSLFSDRDTDALNQGIEHMALNALFVRPEIRLTWYSHGRFVHRLMKTITILSFTRFSARRTTALAVQIVLWMPTCSWHFPMNLGGSWI